MTALNVLRRPVAALALGATLLAGCSMIPTYERPAAPVAGDWPYPAAPGDTVASDLPWQQFFTDERLRRLIAIALDNNRDLRVSILNIEQARAQYDIRRADQVPNVGLSVGGSRVNSGNGGTATHLCCRPGLELLGDRPVRPRRQPERGSAGPVPGDRGRPQGRADQPGGHGRQQLAHAGGRPGTAAISPAARWTPATNRCGWPSCASTTA